MVTLYYRRDSTEFQDVEANSTKIFHYNDGKYSFGRSCIDIIIRKGQLKIQYIDFEFQRCFLSLLTQIEAFVGVVLYLIFYDRHKNDGWIIIPKTPDGEDFGHTCLFKSEVSVTLVLLSALGNMALLLFCSIWDVIPFIRYVWYRYTCQLPKAHKYIEILAFKERALYFLPNQNFIPNYLFSVSTKF